MDSRLEFVRFAEQGDVAMTELCRSHLRFQWENKTAQHPGFPLD
jgi:hypothetical protein